jgi:phosphatidylglycerophosphate synthase
MGVRLKAVEGGRHMGLKAPNILTFMFSVILAVVVLVTTFFHAEVPGIKDHEFVALYIAYGMLVLGCMTNWL